MQIRTTTFFYVQIFGVHIFLGNGNFLEATPVWFWNRRWSWEVGKKNFDFDVRLFLGSWISRLLPPFLGWKSRTFSILIGNGGVQPYKTAVLGRSWKTDVYAAIKEGWTWKRRLSMCQGMFFFFNFSLFNLWPTGHHFNTIVSWSCGLHMRQRCTPIKTEVNLPMWWFS